MYILYVYIIGTHYQATYTLFQAHFTKIDRMVHVVSNVAIIHYITITGHNVSLWSISGPFRTYLTN